MPERYRAQRATTDIATPTTYDEAIAGPQKRQWEVAIADELRSMAINNVWELVDCPQGANLISCKWVFKVKRLPNGNRYLWRETHMLGSPQLVGTQSYAQVQPSIDHAGRMARTSCVAIAFYGCC
jgi:hypothetical protein